MSVDESRPDSEREREDYAKTSRFDLTKEVRPSPKAKFKLTETALAKAKVKVIAQFFPIVYQACPPDPSEAFQQLAETKSLQVISECPYTRGHRGLPVANGDTPSRS
jgi:hypothetical protein